MKTGAELSKLVAQLDAELNIRGIPDYPGALNGLQLQNGGRVRRIVAAVDACLPVVRAASEREGPVLLLVHHGMFWSGAQCVTGSVYEKLRTAMNADLAIYSAHLPLDVHPKLGNNAVLAKALGITKTEPFFEWKGLKAGLRAEVNATRASLVKRLGDAVGGPVHVCAGGPEKVRKVGIITGGAGSEIAAIAAAGVDTFITGEGPHWSYTAAEELGVNLLYGGHYATETFGVKAAAAWLAAKNRLPWEFIDHPTGL
ncbi:MAG TPA: Nif3-like dinuclear metal center hexameric protein [Verrucomicrobiales bacterium]|nr:Nif3-like dinuclear metal center hexameric protein [Verrucomicrobiales bacterium]